PPPTTRENHRVRGARGYAAPPRLGRVKVPCRVLPGRRSDKTRDEYVAELRKHNRQRDKSVAEKVREALVDLDPDGAYQAVMDRRRRSVQAAAYNGVAPLDIEGSMRRYNLSESKDEHVKYVLQVVQERRAYWPLSVRGVHYPLLNFKFIRGYYHPRRADPEYGQGPRALPYANDDGSYDATSDLITRLRLTGQIPWEAFDDPTRPV